MRVVILLVALQMTAQAAVYYPQGDLNMADFSGVGEMANQSDIGQDAERFQGGSGPGYRNRGFGGNRPTYSRVVQGVQNILIDNGWLKRPNSNNGVADEKTLAVIEEAVGTTEIEEMDPVEVQQKVEDYVRNYDPEGIVTSYDVENYNERTERVQRRLNNLGMDIEVDGYHGDQTTEAIKRYQEARGWEPTGTLNETQNNDLTTDSMFGGTAELNEKLGINQ